MSSHINVVMSSKYSLKFETYNRVLCLRILKKSVEYQLQVQIICFVSFLPACAAFQRLRKLGDVQGRIHGT